MPGGPWCVGFAAETESLHDNAQAKRQRKGVPLLVGNLAQDSMGGDAKTFVLFDDVGMEELPRLSKIEAASTLIDAIAKRLPDRA